MINTTVLERALKKVKFYPYGKEWYAVVTPNELFALLKVGFKLSPPRETHLLEIAKELKNAGKGDSMPNLFYFTLPKKWYVEEKTA